MTDVAKAYGNALFALCHEDSVDDEVKEQLLQLLNVFEENPTYLKLLAAPTINKAQRVTLLDESLKENVHTYVLNFFKILCENGYILQSGDCIKEYIKSYNSAHNISLGTVTSAVELSAEQKTSICEKLCNITGKTIVLSYRVDKAILGGITLQLEDTLADGSLKHRLDALRANLANLKMSD
ncbi:MAG: ATP synthase F1 subunit delta [Oscillospiraceae bacterium]